MRILFVTRKFPPSVGGMEVFAEELSLALQGKCRDVTLLKPVPPILGRPGPLALLRFFARASFAILSGVRKTDVVLFGDALLTPLAWLAKLRSSGNVATVVTAHGNDVYYAQRRGIGSTFYKMVLKVFSRYADLLVANSSDTRSVAESLGFRHSITISLATRPIAEALIPQPRTKSILFAGRLMRCKGISWFVSEVMPLIDPCVTLLVAGPTWDMEELDAVMQCPRARYLGTLSRESLPTLRGECIACIMPNLPAHLSGQNEGFGLSALESAAAGVPVVASNLGGLAEAVIEDVTGFLVAPLDADAFARRVNAIAEWTGERRSQFAAGARRAIAQQFTWERVAGDYLSQFEQLLQERSSIHV